MISLTRTPSPPIAPQLTSQLEIPNSHAPAGRGVEFFLNRLCYNLTDTSSFVGWTAAGALSRLANLAVLTPLLRSPLARLWTRGLAAEALAGLAGYAVEGAAFPLATRLV